MVCLAALGVQAWVVGAAVAGWPPTGQILESYAFLSRSDGCLRVTYWHKDGRTYAGTVSHSGWSECGRALARRAGCAALSRSELRYIDDHDYLFKFEVSFVCVAYGVSVVTDFTWWFVWSGLLVAGVMQEWVLVGYV